MKQSKYLVLLCACLGLSLGARAQVARQGDDEREKQELRTRFEQGMQARRMERVQAMNVAVETNRYNHHEEEILATLNTMGIPEDFPVYKPAYTDEQYVGIMKKWYQAHPQMLRNPNANEQK
jgi:hypothetical protein